jgi:Type II CAAX prenyl endopeptidase Rce1-like
LAPRRLPEEGLTEDMRSFSKRARTAALAAIVALTIAILPQGIWSALISINLRATPAVPWAVMLMAGLLTLFWQYLGGKFPPRRTSETRRFHLRANRVPLQVFVWAVLAGSFAVVALTGAWILLAQFIRMPGNVLPPMGNLSWPIVVLAVGMGALISPICEQAGIWGYGQVMLRREFTASTAIVLSALIFAVAPHPPFHVALLPKIAFFFVTGVTFAVIAELTNSILPGLLVHILGLLTFFTLVWPNDPGRRLVKDGGVDIWFFAHVAQVVIFALLAIFAFSRLARVSRGITRSTTATADCD